MKSRRPSAMRSRTIAVTSTPRSNGTTSSPASAAAAASSSAASLAPAEGFKNIVPLLRAVDAMKKVALALVLLQFLVLSAHAAEPKECSFCAGAVGVVLATPLPLLEDVALDDLATLDTLTPAQRAKTAVIVRYALDKDKEPLASVEDRTKQIIDWAKTRGPFDAVGVRVDGADDATAAYAIKRLAVMAQG